MGNEVSPEFRGFDEKILSMYALGLRTRQIQDHLKEIYAVEVSPELIMGLVIPDNFPRSHLPWKRRKIIPNPHTILFFRNVACTTATSRISRFQPTPTSNAKSL
jgi:hypothetical protein